MVSFFVSFFIVTSWIQKKAALSFTYIGCFVFLFLNIRVGQSAGKEGITRRETQARGEVHVGYCRWCQGEGYDVIH